MAFRLFGGLCGVALIVIAGRAASAAPTIGPDMGGYVSTLLGPSEYDYMRHQLNQLPPPIKAQLLQRSPLQVRISIVDGASFTVHYNRPDMIGTLHAEPADPLPGDDYPLTTSATGPAGTCGSPFPGCYSGSGPYRRVYTRPVFPETVAPPTDTNPPTGGVDWGYWNTGTVTTGCNAGSFLENKTHAEAGFSYLGGWSPQPNSPGGTIDAGLQYNWGIKPGISKDDYSLFLKVAGVADFVTQSSDGLDPVPKRVVCKFTRAVSLAFFVSPWGFYDKAHKACEDDGSSDLTNPACSTYALEATYGEAGAPFSAYNIIIYIAPNIKQGGWASLMPFRGYWAGKTHVPLYEAITPCGGCIFKWMTSIGQKNTSPYKEDLHDGSSYGATWSERAIAPWAVIKGSTKFGDLPMTAALTLCSEYPVWGGVYDAGTRDCRNTPLFLAGVGRSISVSDFSLTGETDAISLTH